MPCMFTAALPACLPACPACPASCPEHCRTPCRAAATTSQRSASCDPLTHPPTHLNIGLDMAPRSSTSSSTSSLSPACPASARPCTAHKGWGGRQAGWLWHWRQKLAGKPCTGFLPAPPSLCGYPLPTASCSPLRMLPSLSPSPC